MTYYKVEFLQSAAPTRPAKVFRTIEQGQKYAERILGVAADHEFQSKVKIVAVDSKRKM